jgi:hypothetical protein
LAYSLPVTRPISHEPPPSSSEMGVGLLIDLTDGGVYRVDMLGAAAA